MELKDYWRVLRAHWIAVVAITLIGGLLGAGWAMVQPKTYAASASGILTTGVNSDIGTATIGENYAKSRIKSYLDIAKSTTVAQHVATELELSNSPDDLLSRISVSNPVDTATMKVTAEAGSAAGARDLAEAWIVAIGAQVSEIENMDTDSKQSSMESIVSFQSLDSALLPQSPVFPNNKLATVAGLLGGAIVAIVYALLRNIFDRRVHSTEEVEKVTEASVIGSIPFYKGFEGEQRLLETTGGNDRGEKGRDEYAIAEALRELRTNLQFMSIDNPPRKIVVTSALAAEGKSAIVANLANTIAASGQKVVVIDGDLRRPMVAKNFGLVEGVGLTDVLIGRAEIDEVIQTWGSSGNLFILGAGKIPPNPSELLASNTLHSLIDDLAEHAIVLIDAPPLLPVTDAAILSARTDGALVVTRSNKTTYDELKAAIGNVRKVNGQILGIIINGVSTRGLQGDSYSYRYRSYYGRVQDSNMSDATNVGFESVIQGRSTVQNSEFFEDHTLETKPSVSTELSRGRRASN
ncbi:polysaccharide biosynthesis tyrosine autokinase [Glutamicibacter arilaitensis]|uniref:polysaccharide biosynthesis tyrosine autokinase n=1 Tax=Glutamicibacter arilaitensis TaxID=256701 RepID=UPI003FD05179